VKRIDLETTRLMEYAVSKPDGFTFQDIKDDLGWTRDRFNKVTRRLRSNQAADTINLVCNPQGVSLPWVYRLVGAGALVSPWQANRLGDAESRLITIKNVARSVVNGTNSRTNDGRRARIIEKSLNRLLEDLAEINELDSVRSS
jgi:hypothetical protein